MNTQIISPEARKAILVGRQNHWRFKVVGQGGVPQKPFYKDEWVFELQTTTPDIGQDRINALRASGVRFKGFLVAHEAPRLLSAPKVAQNANDVKKRSSEILPERQFGFIAEFVVIFLQIFFQALLLDPALIVVLEDGTWLEVMTWYE